MQILNKQIDLISSHTEKGLIIPVRFRINLDGELRSYDVKIKVRNETRVDKERVLIFMCEIQDEGIKKECEIRFFTERLNWFLYRL